ncbi:hypothetical protein SDRG_13544 [Saprolegnia diclina VS20]|uniref:Uncharacterized protein n=1 Tax=Saprolegnia diclina (strain VS20) TaxID=1156394 RepID=T0RG52_SAPDV|nr:hypothetical protein SDRG_13544 [Saprolegnia diclina VS20]EQC28667.1 hypothetical protein SDRG_13544 [Saprolegnia diclina VS20]|eukprot:XP_008617859.1 hypothetical protein SDRG_13544 [Saprolegnia diclina VS20]
MPKPTRTTVAVGVLFVAHAVYAACVIALEASMYGELLKRPNARTLSIVLLLASAAGLAHLVWTRNVPSPNVCILLLVLDVVCVSVLLSTAVNAGAHNPWNPMPSENKYPVGGATVFAKAYCASQGHRVCSAFPLVQTIRNLSTLPATLLTVTVTSSTTLEHFCANAHLPPVPSLFNMTSPNDMLTPAYLLCDETDYTPICACIN